MSFLGLRRVLRSRGRAGLAAVLSAVLVAAGAAVVLSTSSATAATNRINLRALVVDDGNPWVSMLTDQFTYEGVPFTKVNLSDAGRPTIDAAYLASGTTANFNAVVLPNDGGGSLSAAELSALSAFEAQFGVRQVDAYVYPGSTMGLNTPVYAGDLNGMTATVTAAAKADGFGYLTGAVPIGVGTYGYLATPATTTMPAGGTFTPLVTVPIPGTSDVGSLMGVYANGGVQKLIVTGAMSTTLSHWRLLAHGVLSWVTNGVHFGYNRSYMTFHFDDAFSYDTRWNAANNCTPGADCPSTVTVTPESIRMTPADVTKLASWTAGNGYKLTMPFNGYYTTVDELDNPWPAGGDPLTNAFVANKNSFIWLNHGYKHIYQGCQQDVTTVPWACKLTSGTTPAADGSNILWLPQADVASEVSANVARGSALGLTFDTTEYLSGEHSGLRILPQQPVDNPNFSAAVTAAGIKYLGADASRETAARPVGGATTVPRHPVAIYYNVGTIADEIDEYNYIYTSRAQGGSGYCEDNPAVATCLAAPLTTADFATYLIPTDVATDLRFITSNDPRPFYAHVSNLTGPDYLGLALIDAILARYNASIAPSAPVVNLTLKQASQALSRQQAWASAGMGAAPSVTGYIEGATVTVTNTSGAEAPITVPAGTTVNGTAFGESYGGEQSAWVTGNQSLTVKGAAFSSPATAAFTAGTAGSFSVTTTSTDGTPVITLSGTLPTGLTFTAGANGTATIAGTPAAGTGGTSTVTLTATTANGTATQALTVNVSERPAFTSAATATFTAGAAGTFTVRASGFPAATITRTGTLPSGLTFTAGSGGTATIAGTPATTASGNYVQTLTATNSLGSATQTLTVTVQTKPAITSTATATATVGTAFTKAITVTGVPAPTVTVAGLPTGLTFTPGTGGGTISGTPAAGTGGVKSVTVTATNAAGTATQTLTLTVNQKPAFTSATSFTATLNRSFTFTVTTSGYPTASLSRSGVLPLGVSWRNNGNGTATISGTPLLLRGTYGQTLTASNVAGSTTQAFSLIVR